MVGLGMIPRGEVGLIFANMGLALAVAGERIVTKEAFAAVVVMVVVTTLLTPPAIRWRLAWTAGRSRSDATAGA
jgi:Kef-type K+ transport system membrane component KefB